ncbi:hypothetical protein YQE_03026, partial [Dendroctonus ponderosae]
MTKMFLGSRQV